MNTILAVLAIAILIVAAAAVTLGVLRPSPDAGRWHKPAGSFVALGLVVLAAVIWWYNW